jgi:hypothetical protein
MSSFYSESLSVLLPSKHHKLPVLKVVIYILFFKYNSAYFAWTPKYFGVRQAERYILCTFSLYEDTDHQILKFLTRCAHTPL